jgi:hypothetical protein
MLLTILAGFKGFDYRKLIIPPSFWKTSCKCKCCGRLLFVSTFIMRAPSWKDRNCFTAEFLSNLINLLPDLCVRTFADASMMHVFFAIPQRSGAVFSVLRK